MGYDGSELWHELCTEFPTFVCTRLGKWVDSPSNYRSKIMLLCMSYIWKMAENVDVYAFRIVLLHLCTTWIPEQDLSVLHISYLWQVMNEIIIWTLMNSYYISCPLLNLSVVYIQLHYIGIYLSSTLFLFLLHEHDLCILKYFPIFIP
jgi:hypothetical protein